MTYFFKKHPQRQFFQRNFPTFNKNDILPEQIFMKDKNNEGSKLSNEGVYLLIRNLNDAFEVPGAIVR